MTTTTAAVSLHTLADFRRAATLGSRWRCDNHRNPRISGLRIITKAGATRLLYVGTKADRSVERNGWLPIPKATGLRFPGGPTVEFLHPSDTDRVAYTWTRLPDLAVGDHVLLAVGTEPRRPGTVTRVVEFRGGGVCEYHVSTPDGQRYTVQPGDVLPAEDGAS